MISIILLAQAASPVVTITPPAAPFDLATVKPTSPCQTVDFAAAQPDVLVCATRPKTPDNLLALADRFETKPFVPRTKLLGGEADVAVEQRSTLSGSAPAAMARFKLRF